MKKTNILEASKRFNRKHTGHTGSNRHNLKREHKRLLLKDSSTTSLASLANTLRDE